MDEQKRLRGDTQTAYLLALDFDLLSGDERLAATERLVALIEAADGHLQTGFLGVRHMLPVLSAAGRDDLAVAMLLKDTYPSWGFSIAHGATTIWERWDGWTPEKGFQSVNMNSFNHYAYGAVGEWIWGRLAGINIGRDSDGTLQLLLAPLFDREINSCSAEHALHEGKVLSAWQFEGDRVTWNIALPPNLEARIVVPQGFIIEAGEPPSGQASLKSGAHQIVLKAG